MPLKQSLVPYFTPSVFSFQEGTCLASADGCIFEMTRPSFNSPGGLYVSAEDLRRMLGPQIQFVSEVEPLEIRCAGRTVSVEGTMFEDALYICVSVFPEKFGYFIERFSTHDGSFTLLAKEKPETINRGDIGYSFRKKVGILHRAYYMEAVGQLIPYHLYVPTYCTPEKKMALAVVLHGLSGRDNFEDAGKELSRLAEENGYIICSPNGYARGMHGSPWPMRRDAVPDNVDRQNPAGLDEEQKRIYPLCEKADMTAVYTVLEQYPINKDQIFLFGNSMGGDGTFHLGQKYNTLWRAIAPCAGGSDLRFYPHERLRGMPVCLLVGTEDPGYENISSLYEEMRKLGLDVRIIRVPGETHRYAWVAALKQIFAFFEESRA